MEGVCPYDRNRTSICMITATREVKRDGAVLKQFCKNLKLGSIRLECLKFCTPQILRPDCERTPINQRKQSHFGDFCYESFC